MGESVTKFTLGKSFSALREKHVQYVRAIEILAVRCSDPSRTKLSTAVFGNALFVLLLQFQPGLLLFAELRVGIRALWLRRDAPQTAVLVRGFDFHGHQELAGEEGDIKRNLPVHNDELSVLPTEQKRLAEQHQA